MANVGDRSASEINLNSNPVEPVGMVGVSGWVNADPTAVGAGRVAEGFPICPATRFRVVARARELIEDSVSSKHLAGRARASGG
jgi:hypothetical protein